jgi:CheY-like chemotaxis protein
MRRSKLSATKAQPRNSANEEYILQVEDQPDDVLFFSIGTEAAAITNPIRVAGDGRIAIELLTAAISKIRHDPSALPRLVLLDLNLPFIPGINVLRWIRLQPPLRALPVLILSSSDHPDDIRLAHELGATSYITKPADFFDLLAFANQLKLWLMNKGPLPASTLWQQNTEKFRSSPAPFLAPQHPTLSSAVPSGSCSQHG